jgi:hypothetical protein
MIAASSSTVAPGIFDHQKEAANAIHALKNAGFSDADIGIASRDWSKQFDSIRVDEQHIAERGAVAGAALGASLGAVFGLVGAIVVPGAIPVLAGSAVVSALLGGAAGAAGGAYAGPFIAMGFSEMESEDHNRHIEEGKTVIIVHAPDRLEDARKIMVHEGAYDEAMATGV